MEILGAFGNQFLNFSRNFLSFRNYFLNLQKNFRFHRNFRKYLLNISQKFPNRCIRWESVPGRRPIAENWQLVETVL